MAYFLLHPNVNQLHSLLWCKGNISQQYARYQCAPFLLFQVEHHVLEIPVTYSICYGEVTSGFHEVLICMPVLGDL